MRHLLAATVALLMGTSVGALHAQAADAAPELKCNVGPVSKTFGKTPWLVYACDDGKSLVVVSAPGSPAMPFYFFFLSKAGKYELVGEGTGRKEATAAAYAELSALPESAIVKLLAEAKAGSR